MYLVYSMNTVADPYSYLTDPLFLRADQLYVFNAAMYMLSCLRDYKLFSFITESTVYDYMLLAFCNRPLKVRNTDRFIYIFGIFCYEKHGLLSKAGESGKEKVNNDVELQKISGKNDIISNILHNSDGSSLTKRPTVLQAIMNSTNNERQRAAKIDVKVDDEGVENIVI